MDTNFLKYCLFTITLFISLMVSKIAISAFYSSFMLYQGDFIEIFIRSSFYQLSIFSVISSLPLLTIGTLFTVQYNRIGLTVENIIYIVIISLVGNLIPFGFRLLAMYFIFDQFYQLMQQAATQSLFSVYYFFGYVFMIAVIGLISHAYFTKYPLDSTRSLSKKITLILITQTVLASYAFIFSSIYGIVRLVTVDYGDNILIVNALILAIFIINFGLLFICFYGWNHAHLSSRISLNNYVFKAMQAFVFTNAFILLLSAAVSFILFIIHMIIEDFTSTSMVVLSYLIGCALFVFMFRCSTWIPYKVMCCIIYLAPIFIFNFLSIPYAFTIYGLYIGILSVSLFVWYLANKLAVQSAFR